MVINFVNNCESKIYVVSDIWDGIIAPKEKIRITCGAISNLTFSVNIYYTNIIEKGVYNLNLVSLYKFKDIDNNAEFVFTREKIRVSLYISYERLFVETTSATQEGEQTYVKNPEQIKKRFKRDRFVELLYSPFTHFPGLSIIFIIGGIILAWLLDWQWGFMYYLLGYLFLFGLHGLIDIFWKYVSKKAFKIDDVTEFYQFFDSQYISQYYSQTIRAPFMGKIDCK